MYKPYIYGAMSTPHRRTSNPGRNINAYTGPVYRTISQLKCYLFCSGYMNLDTNIHCYYSRMIYEVSTWIFFRNDIYIFKLRLPKSFENMDLVHRVTTKTHIAYIASSANPPRNVQRRVISAMNSVKPTTTGSTNEFHNVDDVACCRRPPPAAHKAVSEEYLQQGRGGNNLGKQQTQS